MHARGYGENQPKQIRRRLAEAHEFLNEGDTLTEAFIMKLKPEEQEICNALNRRTEFKVLRTTYGMTLEEYSKEEGKQSLDGQAADRQSANEPSVPQNSPMERKETEANAPLQEASDDENFIF